MPSGFVIVIGDLVTAMAPKNGVSLKFSELDLVKASNRLAKAGVQGCGNSPSAIA